MPTNTPVLTNEQLAQQAEWFAVIAASALKQGAFTWSQQTTIDLTELRASFQKLGALPYERKQIEALVVAGYELAKSGVAVDYAQLDSYARSYANAVYALGITDGFSAKSANTAPTSSIPLISTDTALGWYNAGYERGQFMLSQVVTPDENPDEKKGSSTALWVTLGLATAAAVGIGVYATRESAMSKNPAGYARRYIGDAVIYITYRNHEDDYEGKIVAGGKTWHFDGLRAPRVGFNFGYDSPKAYDEMAENAVAFGHYYTTDNRGDDVPDWAPEPDVADAIDEATFWARKDSGDYKVSRSKRS